MATPIPDKRKLFCQAYINCWNATQAARDAGYSENTVRSQGGRMLRDPKCKKLIKKYMNQIEKRSGVSKLRNVQELAKIAYVNMGNLRKDWMTLKEFELLTDEERACISEIQTETRVSGKKTNTIIKFKLHSKTQAVTILNQMLGYNAPTKHDLESGGKSLAPVIIVPDVKAD